MSGARLSDVYLGKHHKDDIVDAIAECGTIKDAAKALGIDDHLNLRAWLFRRGITAASAQGLENKKTNHATGGEGQRMYPGDVLPLLHRMLARKLWTNNAFDGLVSRKR